MGSGFAVLNPRVHGTGPGAGVAGVGGLTGVASCAIAALAVTVAAIIALTKSRRCIAVIGLLEWFQRKAEASLDLDAQPTVDT